MLSRACQYGILATLYLANHTDRRYVPVHMVAGDLGLSPHFLAKIVQEAGEAGIFRSYRGPNGGVSLGRAPQAIRLRDIVESIDGMAMFEKCVLGLPGCGSKQPCPMHAAWGVIRSDFVKMLEETTVLDLSRRVEQDGLRLSSLEVLGIPKNKTKA